MNHTYSMPKPMPSVSPSSVSFLFSKNYLVKCHGSVTTQRQGLCTHFLAATAIGSAWCFLKSWNKLMLES